MAQSSNESREIVPRVSSEDLLLRIQEANVSGTPISQLTDVPAVASMFVGGNIGGDNVQIGGNFVQGDVYQTNINFPLDSWGTSSVTEIPPPPLPAYHVERTKLEFSIRKHLQKSRSKPKSLLLLWGLGSAGKTCLTKRAYYIAKEVGYDLVIWFDSKNIQRLDVLRKLASVLKLPRQGEEEDLAMTIKERLSERNLKILAILDDLENDHLLQLDLCVDHFVVTSREKTIGQHSCFVRDKVLLEIKGLEKEENEQLLSEILDKDDLTKLKNEKKTLYKAVEKLCADSNYMPLMTNIIGSIIKEDRNLWITDHEQYVTDLNEQIDQLKSEFCTKPKRAFLHTGTDYPYGSVYSAIKLSVDRLDSKMQNKFLLLSIFERGDRILPVTVSRLWNKKTYDTVKTLRHLCNKTILIDESTTANQIMFKLHDLVFDIVQKVTENQREKFADVVITSYLPSVTSRDDKYTSVDFGDEFFYLSFVGFSVRSGKEKIASQCLCRLRYLMERVVQYSGVGVLSDFTMVGAKMEDNEVLHMYEDVIQMALHVSVRERDPHIILRAALFQPHESVVFIDARNVITTLNLHRIELHQLRDNPLPVDKYHTSEFMFRQDHKEVKVERVDDFDKNNHRLLVIGYYKNNAQALLYDMELLKMQALSDQTNVKLVRFVPGCRNVCVIVTNIEITICDIIEVTNTAAEWPRQFCTRSDCTKQVKSGEPIHSAVLKDDNLWVVCCAKSKVPRVNHYLLSESGIQESREFICSKKSNPFTSIKIISSSDGRSVAVYDDDFCAEMFSLNSQSADGSVCRMLGDIMEVQDDKVVMRVRQENKFDFYNVSLKDHVEEIFFSTEGANPAFFRLDSGKILIVNVWGKCVILPDKADFLLPGCDVDGLSFHHNALFSSVGLQVKMYSMTPYVTYSAVNALSKRGNWFEWCDFCEDFVVIFKKTKCLDVCTVLNGIDLLKDVQVDYELWLPHVSVSRRHGRIAIVTSPREVKEWKVSYQDGKLIDVSEEQSVTFKNDINAICHSDDEERLYVVVMEKQHALYEVTDNETIDQRLLLFDTTDFGRKLRVCNQFNFIVAFQGIGKKLLVWPLEGKEHAILEVNKVFDFSLSSSCLAVQTKTGIELWNLQDVDSDGIVDKMFSVEDSGVVCHALNPAGTVLVFHLRNGDVYVFEQMKEQAILLRANRYVVDQISWWENARSVVLVGDDIRIIPFHSPRPELNNSHVSLVASWLNVNKFYSCRVSPDSRWLVIEHPRGYVILENVHMMPSQ